MSSGMNMVIILYQSCCHCSFER